MPAWIHERADHIRRKNPSMPESQAFAIATQQSYAAGKAPKGYGTADGRRVAKKKKKYDEPKSEYTKTPSPSHKTKTSALLALWKGLGDELEKIATTSSTGPTRSAGPSQVIKTKPPMPKLVSKPLTKDPDPPASTADQISSSRTIVPPPVTAAGAY